MAPPSPARLFATLVGAVLFVAGIAGFFQDLDWLNYLYVASGAAGLLLAAAAPRGSRSPKAEPKEPRKRRQRLKPRAKAAAKGS